MKKEVGILDFINKDRLQKQASCTEAYFVTIV